jgi:hypothetical protein
VADLGLADAMDATEALLQLVRIPGQVVVDHQVRAALEVHAFAGGVVGDQEAHLRVVHKTARIAGKMMVTGEAYSAKSAVAA